jgi:uncharacterized protein (TIGR00251 family)
MTAVSPSQGDEFPCREVPGGVEFAVLVSAGSSRSAVRGRHGDALKIAVRAAPEQGKANAEVAEVLAEFLGLPRKQVGLVAGLTSRHKRVQAFGITVQGLQARIPK